MRKFKVGDFIKCIDADDIRGDKVEKGGVYEIDYIVRGLQYNNQMSTYYIHLKGVKTSHALHPNRFIHIWEDTKLGKLL